MFYHLMVTDDCNLCCSYCRAKMFDEEDEPMGSPGTIDETITENFSCGKAELYTFLAKDEDAVLTFIGGEPLLNIPFVRQVMDEAPVKRFMLQTNGTKLLGLGAPYINRLETILISIDGDAELTNGHRGEGIYETVTNAARKIR
ncbi:MAG TPA: 4Fe-4S cluster-binding domain-containing protein, partial [Methanocorpusculum sp.]|nr:4Fe-4S cluster-binding domain-containing protein [Methanocorpusculum sp.]